VRELYHECGFIFEERYAVGIAGRMAGPGGKLAAKMVAVSAAGVVRDKLSRQMQSCSG